MKKYICSEKEMIEEEEMIPQELMPVEKGSSKHLPLKV